MGIVVNQSIKNTVITFVGFAIGALNTLFMYTNFLGEDYYGLSAFLLSSANLMMPLMAFGVQNTLVKYYTVYHTDEDKSRFLNYVLVLPFVFIIPFTVLGLFFYTQIATLLSQENAIIYDYVWIIPVVGLFMGYFEIFYAWVKVHFQSVYGNFLKEVMLRVIVSIFLFAVYFKWISPEQFIYSLVFIYGIVMLLMAFTAFKVRRPQFYLRFPKERKEIITYSTFIIFSSSIAVLLLDVDKFMIAQYIPIKEAAYYSVAIFIALTVSVPMRAMHQITHPITTNLMARNKHDELNDLYKKTSITLQVIGGGLLLGILVNIHQIYTLLPEKYAGGITVVFIITLSKFFDLMLGNNNSIIFNSKYYRIVLSLGLGLVVMAVALNMILIPEYGIEGAAIATLISLVFYSVAKLLFVVVKMNLFPFTSKTWVSILIIGFTFGAFYFWDFPWNPIVNIVLKSGLLTIVYAGLNYFAVISEDINEIINKSLRFIK